MTSRAPDLDFYASQGPFTEPGAFGSLLDSVPADIPSIKDVTHQLVFHYRGGGDWAEHRIGPERIAEINTRYADQMLRHLVSLHDCPMGAARQPHQRLVGCCCDVTLLFVTIARPKGIPARSRVGFAGYFVPGLYLDHVVAEVWDAQEERWRLVEAELAEGYVDQTDGTRIDPLDVPRDRFIIGPQAWLACRSGEADPEAYLVAPDLDIPGTRSWPYLLRNLVHDLAAMNKREMILWDDWGITEPEFPLSSELQDLLDHAAKLLVSPDTALAELQRLYAREEFRVPEVVTSYSPAVENPPIRVQLDRLVAAT